MTIRDVIIGILLTAVIVQHLKIKALKEALGMAIESISGITKSLKRSGEVVE